jgi:hypothetical protein
LEEVIALAIRGNPLKFHGLVAGHTGHERYEWALIIIHSASNRLPADDAEARPWLRVSDPKGVVATSVCGPDVRHDDVLRMVNARRKLGSLPCREIPMGVKFQDTWYVSFELKRFPPVKRAFARATATFRGEIEAKEFAKLKVAEADNVSAGTLNPHVPKRVISPLQIVLWLEEH